MKIYLAADHAGYELKEAVKEYLLSKGMDTDDLGAFSFDEADDYTDVVIPAARKVAEDEKESRAFVFGGSGQGEAIAANKIPGIRAAVYYGGPLDIVELSRRHNDANILSFGARFLSQDEAFRAVDCWLETEFESGRHGRRLEKIRAEEFGA
ncbi:MAG: RpiB/LacA/LacB family sugar-phosphate isomerase [Candidatus Wildermuthbacteria bacterium]|nr:RpiB/LacA/LacB family sugar-phosphate isomerase [Candidatus Wildermuthbacteria bacterium]